MKIKIIIAFIFATLSALIFAIGANTTDTDVSSTENKDGPKVTFECYEDGSTKIVK